MTNQTEQWDFTLPSTGVFKYRAQSKSEWEMFKTKVKSFPDWAKSRAYDRHSFEIEDGKIIQAWEYNGSVWNGSLTGNNKRRIKNPEEWRPKPLCATSSKTLKDLPLRGYWIVSCPKRWEKILRKLEDDYPQVRWGGGQKPTGWGLSGDYPTTRALKNGGSVALVVHEEEIFYNLNTARGDDEVNLTYHPLWFPPTITKNEQDKEETKYHQYASDKFTPDYTAINDPILEAARALRNDAEKRLKELLNNND